MAKKHPFYTERTENWVKFALTYYGADAFKRQYLVRYSKRESDDDFRDRMKITPIPGFAAANLDETKNAIHQRMVDVQRVGGPQSYQDACNGKHLGVDRQGHTMNQFIGLTILERLCVFGGVGVLVDRGSTNGLTNGSITLASTGTRRDDSNPANSPYLTMYDECDIVNWRETDPGQPGQFKAVVLRENHYEYDDIGLPSERLVTHYRRLYLNPEGKVSWQLFREAGAQKQGELFTQEATSPAVMLANSAPADGALGTFIGGGTLELTVLPFVWFRISKSLLFYAADYQIALMNMSSSDIAWVCKANFPLYTEMQDTTQRSNHLRQPNSGSQSSIDTAVPGGQPTDTEKEITVGASQGRSYAKGLERPGFIAPPSEPLQASMAKQDAMKEEMRQLIHLALGQTQSVSAASKAHDRTGLESGLSNIGLELETGERLIAEIWAQYEGQEAAEITYPPNYTLRTEADILKQAKEMSERMYEVPSELYRKEMLKGISRLMLKGKVTSDVLDKILKQIDDADILITDPEKILSFHEQGLIDDVSAAKVLTIPASAIKQAREDHLLRLQRIAQASNGVIQGKAASAADPTEGTPIRQADAEKNISQQSATNTTGTGDQTRGTAAPTAK